MRLHYFLMIVMATLGASNGAVSATSVTGDSKYVKTNEVKLHLIKTFQTGTRRKRFLRTGDTSKMDYYYDPNKRGVFIEDKLEKSLTNRSRANKLYEEWYKSGYSAKTVASGLNQDENRELVRIYKELAQGYAAYIKNKSL
ncbi:hypothetical protein L917_03579 [Phytophthora nicotianae]|uniref:RxLR effector protein n=2 Tax=Phytophthora nicotianae TaxID=4792 RepID=W2QLH1_PHYN3|nr:hypothetical protein PPTG_08655 [Phytophthora nicotianae INRA-310]ETK93030.1 hypothetical protein L915_03719 [Phytophthora nicotianae]KUF82438.1 hypothetical protein AM587_10011056 [Phytophthora nicotianae]ETL99588.1 hypothetical protein L917_03579 [Phytophthora nicotianae]ETN13993.1 hypothetical protein PPTG_08655 [Phytophthora nicotianae INRA-310]KUF85139.1 hypothetical protein AM587_10002183 [Phytophthora nicotianae]